MGLNKITQLAFAGAAYAALPPIHITGTKFFYENGTQFFMKGIAYQQDTSAAGQTNEDKTDYIDPLSDEDICKKDVPLLEELGINTIRTYAIDPEADHSGCMKLLDDAGIYVISDLSQPQLSIDRSNPSWNVPLYNRYMAVVDELAQYQNVIGFFAGNEVSDAANNTEASAYVKAALRDTKRFIADQDYGRQLGVGYASNDHPDIRNEIAQYFNCGSDDEATDYWGYNIYSWCGESTLQRSGYDTQVEFFEDYNVPVFFAEYGCNTGRNGAEDRIFQETGALYSDDMTGVFSGGIVYMYHQEENDYGVVEYKNGKPERMDNFFELKREHAEADPTRIQEDDYTPSGEREECPDIQENWKASSSLPPTPDEELCNCVVAASSCVPKSNLKPKDFGDIFDTICGGDAALCVGINGNATTGIYGAYSMCGDRAKLAHVMHEYYQAQDEAFDACDFDGAGETQDPETGGDCEDALASAEALNEEAATATGDVGAASPTGTTGGSSDDSEDDEGAASHMGVGLYMAVAMAVGGVMVAL